MSEARPQHPLQIEVVANSEVGGEASNVVHWVFPGETLRFGRARRPGQFAISGDSALSKQHFEVSYASTGCVLRDLDSANGTFVNGTQVYECDLENGDEISAGQMLFLVSVLYAEDVADHAPTEILPAMEESDQHALSTAVASITAPPPPTQPPRFVVVRVQFDKEVEKPVSSRLVAWLRTGQRITIGSSEIESDWQLDFDEEIAPKHFRLAFDGNRCELRSLNFDRGTYLNGEEVEVAEIKDQDAIRAGSTSFMVELG